MNRETVIAIIMGIVLGGLVGFFVLLKSPRLEKTKVIPVSQTSAQKTPTKNTKSEKNIVFSLAQPTDYEVTPDEEIELKGKAPDKSLIVAQSPAGRSVAKTEGTQFTVKIPLALGENVIHLSAYSSSGAPQDALLHIYRIEE